MKPDDQLIAEVRALDAKATKGPFHISRYVNYRGWAVYAGERGCIAERWYDQDQSDEYNAEMQANADFFSESRTLLPDLANRLEAALKAIEDAPHGHDCKLGRPNKLKTGTVDFPCTCWKSRALNKPTKPTP